jgi:hypothetical protein
MLSGLKAASTSFEGEAAADVTMLDIMTVNQEGKIL